MPTIEIIQFINYITELPISNSSFYMTIAYKKMGTTNIKNVGIRTPDTLVSDCEITRAQQRSLAGVTLTD